MKFQFFCSKSDTHDTVQGQKWHQSEHWEAQWLEFGWNSISSWFKKHSIEWLICVRDLNAIPQSCLNKLQILWLFHKHVHYFGAPRHSHWSALRIMTFRGRIFSRVWPIYEWAVSDLDRPMHRSLWVWVTHSSFTKGSHMTKNTASA